MMACVASMKGQKKQRDNANLSHPLNFSTASLRHDITEETHIRIKGNKHVVVHKEETDKVADTT